MFNRIISYHPYDAFDRFEEISTLVKDTQFNLKEPKHDSEINGNGPAQARLTNREAIAYIDKAKELLKEAPGAGIKKSDRKLLTKDKQFIIPNLAEQGQMLEWAGINFGEDNYYML